MQPAARHQTAHAEPGTALQEGGCGGSSRLKPGPGRGCSPATWPARQASAAPTAQLPRTRRPWPAARSAGQPQRPSAAGRCPRWARPALAHGPGPADTAYEVQHRWGQLLRVDCPGRAAQRPVNACPQRMPSCWSRAALTCTARTSVSPRSWPAVSAASMARFFLGLRLRQRSRSCAGQSMGGAAPGAAEALAATSLHDAQLGKRAAGSPNGSASPPRHAERAL